MRQQNDGSSNHSNIVVMPTELNFLRLLQIHDSAFPIGSYTHSYGMETYIQDDRIRTKENLIDFCKSFLFQNLMHSDAILIKEAYDAAAERDVDRLLYLENLSGAIKLAKESRDASVNLGRQFIRTVSPLVKDPFFNEWKERVQKNAIKGHYPILYAIYCAVSNVKMEHAVMTYLFSSLNGLITNAVRAVPFGQNTGVQAMYELIDSVMEATTTVISLSEDDICNNALGIELASMAHEYLFSRLFIS